MAFGFGFNKQKVLGAAEKFVQQGKLQGAISEYEKILKHDGSDLTVHNTIGDLYSRLGDSGKAIECFKKVGDAYAAQGFTVKGIAMYKKITKLQPSVDASLKLAELYTQQGLFNDARAQYLQVAEDFLKSGDLEQAVRLFQKVLEMDPENVPMRVKLAEVYVRLGRKQEAWEIFVAAAEALRARGALAGAEDILKRMLTLEPGNSYVLLLRGKAALENGDPKNAVAYLEKAPDIDSHPDGLRDLLKAYLQIGPLPKAVPIAEKLLTVHNDPEGMFLLAEGCARLGEYRQALEVYNRHADRLLATDTAKLMASLHSMITHVREDSTALDAMLSLLGKAGDTTHVNEVIELLAHSSVKDGNLARARDLYRMLATTEPQNQLHLQNYQQVVGRMDGAAAGITAEEGAVIVEELEANAPLVDQTYPDGVAIALRSAVTDADLFLSYNLPEKAIVPLLGALPQAPNDVRLNQRLAALHTRFQRFAEAARCCRTLECVYHEAGYPDEALRYGELAARYEHSTDGSDNLMTAAAPTDAVILEPAEAMPWPTPPSALAILPVNAPGDEPGDSSYSASETALAEGYPSSSSSDLSSEWEDSVRVGGTVGVPADGHTDRPVDAIGSHLEGVAVREQGDADERTVAETAEEVSFYLKHLMTEQARSCLEKLETLTSDAGILDPLRAALETAARPLPELEAEITEINGDNLADNPAEAGIESYVAEKTAADFGFAVDPPPSFVAGDEFQSPQSVPVLTGNLSAMVSELEASLGESFPRANGPRHGATDHGEFPANFSPASFSPANLAAGPTDAHPAGISPQAAAAAATSASYSSTSGLSSTATSAAAPAAPATAPAMSYSPSPVRPLGTGAQAMHAAGSVDLSQMFGALKMELEEEVVAGDDDPETHYNLGVAFREMGLLEEAIAELQKVCIAIDRGKPFAQPVQTYTWLAQCFIDKGVPEAAIRWYEKALNLPGLDDEARLAINYELGSACETARDNVAALRHFTAVYGSNIDYRDVAERIQALKS